MPALDRRRATALRASLLASVLVGATLAPSTAVQAATPAAATSDASASVAAVGRAAPRVFTLGTPKRSRGGIRVAWHVRRTLRRASLRVNGRSVPPSQLRFRRGQRIVVPLDAADGVRFGRNAIVAVARGENGRRQVVRRTVTVRRGAPLPAIRAATGAAVGTPVRLDARRSRASSGPQLRYRWRIVRAPRGARARLRGTHSARARLVASEPGRYWLALTVTERGGRDARRGDQRHATTTATTAQSSPTATCTVATSPQAESAAPAPLPLTPPLLTSTPAEQLPAGALTLVPAANAPSPPPPPPPAGTAGAGCATQVEAVAVAPSMTPMGAAIDTSATVNGETGIALNGALYALPGENEGVGVLLLDAATLEVLDWFTLDSGQPATAVAESAAASYASSDDILIVAAGGPKCCIADNIDARAGFSLIENYVPGGGLVTSNEGLVLGDGSDTPGELVGWLQLGVALDGTPPLYTYISPDRAPFDTQVQSAAPSNTMQIDGASYSSTLPAGASAGFQVIVTDPAMQPILGTPIAFGTNAADPNAAALQEGAMAALIVRAQQQPGATVFVQSIGDPQPASQYAPSIASALAEFGADEWMFLSLDGSGGYAFAGNLELDVDDPLAATAETAEQWTEQVSNGQGNGDGTLTGMLRRRSDSSFSPTLAVAIDGSSVNVPTFGLSQVAFQPAQPWPLSTTPAQVAATSWFADQLDLDPGPGTCWPTTQPDFRASYCNLAQDTSSLVVELQQLDYAQNPDFGASVFRAVRNELVQELAYVGTVQSLIATLQAPFGTATIAAAVDVNTIAGEVITALPPPRRSATSGDLAIAGAVFDAASVIPEVGKVLGVVGSALDIGAAATQSGGTGSPYWQVQTSADAIGATIQQRLATVSGSLGQLEQILVSDYGKLSIAAQQASGAWGVSETTLQAQESVIALGVEQWMWTAIAPAAFELNSFPGGTDPAILFCETDYYGKGWYPFSSAALESVFIPLNTWSSGAPASSGMFGMLDGSVGKRSSQQVDPALAVQMFSGPPAGAGLLRPWFLARAAWTTVTPPWNQGYANQPGTCNEAEPGAAAPGGSGR